ncbi:MAG: DMT family transporter, partial [Hyphomonadaceae bacterium]
ASALLYSLTVTGMKVMTRDHGAAVLIVWSSVLGLLFSAPLAALEWRWPSFPDFCLLAAMGVCSLATQACYIKAMILGDAAAMAPLDYVRLIFALIAGFVLFHEIPDGVTMLGAAVVIAATLYITIREARLNRIDAEAPLDTPQ